jgi:hypothetical protein
VHWRGEPRIELFLQDAHAGLDIALGERFDAGHAGVEIEQRNRQQQKEPGREDGTDNWSPHHACGQPGGDSGTLVGVSHGRSLPVWPVDAIAKEAEQRGNQRQHRGERDNDDDDRARADAGEDRRGDHEESKQREHDSKARDENRPAGGTAGSLDRVDS